MSFFIERGRHVRDMISLAKDLGVAIAWEKKVNKILAMSDGQRQKKMREVNYVVNGFLGSLRYVSRVQEPGLRKEAHQATIEPLNRLIPILPDLEYQFRGFLGVSYQEIGEMREALKNFEQSVLLHPDPSSEELYFPTYAQNYLNCVRLITQRAIPHIDGSERHQSIQDLIMVVNSTSKLYREGRASSEICYEHQAANSWLKKTGVRRRAISQGRN